LTGIKTAAIKSFNLKSNFKELEAKLLKHLNIPQASLNGINPLWFSLISKLNTAANKPIRNRV